MNPHAHKRSLPPKGALAALQLCGTDLQLCPQLIKGVAARQEAP
jgi:hypothetical protein